MLLKLKNKEHLIVDEFKFKCSICKRGLIAKKKEGDNSTPRGVFKIGKVFYRPDRVKKPETILKTKTIKENMGWCDDPYNKNYKPTKGCIAIKKKDLLILLKIINKKSKIRIC